ncbi:hypothetical protein ABT263_28175 [Kitasatospora sp. NPDC001603]|uniref:hypothetical protein n=1 Tax=Kitasatospora sp. NPDC001603 TaxID=3154388 RepID=UPI003327C96D
MNPIDEELLRTVLERTAPISSNPQRFEEVSARFRTARRRRRRATAAGVTLAVTGAFMQVVVFAGPEKPASVTPASWAPTGFAELKQLSPVPRHLAPGWHTVQGLPTRTGSQVVITYTHPAGACPETSASTTCAARLDTVAPGSALVLYTPAPGGSRTEVRAVSPVDPWCYAAGGTQELVRTAGNSRNTNSTGDADSYACLNGAPAEITTQAAELLRTGTLADGSALPAPGPTG